ncbi:MAG: DUF4352 domain-containing protein [Thermoleophilia bacterium]|nr:DUF4352 domain-containing protein [Thermoleophilia bacterium]
MPRLLLALLVVGLTLVATAGCTVSETGTITAAETTETSVPTDSSAKPSPTKEPQTTTSKISGVKISGVVEEPWGGTAKLKGLEITVAAPVDDTANLDEITREMLLEPNQKAVYCMVSISNIGDEPYSYNALAFTMYDTEGMKYESLMAPCSKPDLGTGQVLPGKTVKGAVAFAMPEDATPSYVVFQRDIFSDIEAKWGE